MQIEKNLVKDFKTTFITQMIKYVQLKVADYWTRDVNLKWGLTKMSRFQKSNRGLSIIPRIPSMGTI